MLQVIGVKNSCWVEMRNLRIWAQVQTKLIVHFCILYFVLHPLRRHSALLLSEVWNQVKVAAVNVAAAAWIEGKAVAVQAAIGVQGAIEAVVDAVAVAVVVVVKPEIVRDKMQNIFVKSFR